MKMQREHLTVITPPRPAFDERRHGDADALAIDLARCVAHDLRSAIARRGEAKVALSGGSTPLRWPRSPSRNYQPEKTEKKSKKYYGKWRTLVQS